MKKRIFIILLTLCLAVVAMTVMAFAEIASGTAWVLDDDGTLSFSGIEGMNEWIDTYRATYCEEVTSIVFYDGITNIPDKAFDGCSNLTSITIPNTVTGIGDQAFYGCSSLTTVIIPSNVETIGSSAFERCSGLQSLVIENCGLEFNASSQSIDENIIIQPAHTYSGGVCSVCNHTDSDYVIVGSAELHDGYYTEYGTNVVSGDPEYAGVSNYAYYSNSVLYLKNFSYTGTGGTSSTNAVIKPNSGDLTVSLSGSSTISGEGYGFYSNVGSITFESTSDTEQGSLTVSAYVNTIYGSSSSVIVIDNVIIKSSGANIYSGVSITQTLKRVE
ncbi:MAG: leucine-rich repeat domain-containing protein [Oscillospiraceae bacterium]|nr:leucine-rich repeat domain-containing protein [Oscillospiraceae bacterium]